jgi:hypothetical protein
MTGTNGLIPFICRATIPPLFPALHNRGARGLRDGPQKSARRFLHRLRSGPHSLRPENFFAGIKDSWLVVNRQNELGAVPQRLRREVGLKGLGTHIATLRIPITLSLTLSLKKSRCLSGARLKQVQAVKLVAHESVALAGGFLKPRAVLDGHVAPRVVKQASSVKYSCSHGHRGARCAQHGGQKLMRQRHPVCPYAVVTGEQPASQPFSNVVQPVAGSILRTLNKIGQQVLLQVTPQRSNSSFRRLASMRNPLPATWIWFVLAWSSRPAAWEDPPPRPCR